MGDPPAVWAWAVGTSHSGHGLFRATDVTLQLLEAVSVKLPGGVGQVVVVTVLSLLAPSIPTVWIL